MTDNTVNQALIELWHIIQQTAPEEIKQEAGERLEKLGLKLTSIENVVSVGSDIQ